MARLELRGLEKAYPNGINATRSIDLTIEDGELFTIVGPSGSGKSTLLRLIAGLESPDSGSVWLGGRRIDGLAPKDRGVAMVFQDSVLYPHLDVFENIAFGLRARRRPRAEVEGTVRATSSALGLGDCLRRSPSTLSGGQRRRVALGRAMVLRPEIFLLDEPFTGLDAPLRASTRADLIDLRRAIGATMILVTHDQAEAMAMGDRVAVLDRGRLLQVGRPLDVYDRPASRAVGRFIGQPPMAILPFIASEAGGEIGLRLVEGDDLGPWTFPGSIPWASAIARRATPRVDLGIRAEDVAIGATGPGQSGGPSMTGPGIVLRMEPAGHETIAAIGFGPHRLAARLPAWTTIRVGDRPTIGIDLDRASWFDSASGDRIE